MTPLERKKVTVIAKYAIETFSESDWLTLGQITGGLAKIQGHSRLLRALSFGDEDYGSCAVEVLNELFNADSGAIADVIDHFDIELWYQAKDPAKFSKIFQDQTGVTVDFWKDGYLKLFVSHLSSSKRKISAVKVRLQYWGVSAFLAHEDIQPSREWRDEVEAALKTMDVLCAFVEEGFKESDWCAQEVGYALGRNIEVIPLQLRQAPFGFFGKIQALNIEGKLPETVADELARLMIGKSKYFDAMLRGIMKSFSGLQSEIKVGLVRTLDSWGVLSTEKTKSLVEGVSLSYYEKKELSEILRRVGAFIPAPAIPIFSAYEDDDIPF